MMIKQRIKLASVSVGLIITLNAIAVAQEQSPASNQREVAITFDDLPLTRMNPKTWRQTTAKLLACIASKKIPAIGFVNEGKLYEQDRLDTARVALLHMWLDAGLELGNHSFSHWDLHRITAEKFKAAVLRGERITAKLLAKQGKKLRYFRHPFLHTGTSLAIKKDIEAFLSRYEYAVAPVTVDNSEWIFAHAYVLAAERNDEMMMKRIGETYGSYMEAKFEYYEKQSRDLFGYEIKQTLLLHANALNGDYFARWLRCSPNAAMFSSRSKRHYAIKLIVQMTPTPDRRVYHGCNAGP